MSKRLIAVLAAVVALVALAAGCGSSDDSTTDTGSATVTITKAQLIAQGDAICKQGNEEIEEGFEQFQKENDIPKNQEPNDDQGVEIVETVIVPSIKTQSELIRGLGTRSARHVVTRADLLALEVMVHLCEGYRERYQQRCQPPRQLMLPGLAQPAEPAFS